MSSDHQRPFKPAMARTSALVLRQQRRWLRRCCAVGGLTVATVSLLNACHTLSWVPEGSPQTTEAAASALQPNGAVAEASASAVATSAPATGPVTPLVAAAPANPAAVDDTPFVQQAAVQSWAASVAERNALDISWVHSALAQAQRAPQVARLIAPAPGGAPKNWLAYRSRFIEPRRVKAGLSFWQGNEAWLTKAQQRFGVPPEIIVGLLGVETIYGQHTGGFRVLDALTTLGFAYPEHAPRDRSPYFRKELEQFLLLCHEESIAPAQPLGSYAGAMGIPQFMPGSWRRWAIDFDGDGRVDLLGNVADAIGSVAHYLAQHGWQADKPTHFAVRPPEASEALAKLLIPDIVPKFSSQDMSALGAGLNADGTQYPGLLALIKLENGTQNAPSYVAGTGNFYALTRYNQSSLYAMAVIELGQTIAQERISR